MDPGSSQASAAAFHSDLASKATPRNIYRVSTNPASGNQNVNFPVKLGTTDPMDERFAIQKALVGGNGVVSNMGIATVGQDYYDYVKRKMEVTQESEFEDWLMKQADFQTPESTEYWYSHFPWMLNKRTDEVDRVAALQRQAGHIAVRGPENADDWRFLFAKQKGLITVPDTPPHMLGVANYVTDNYIAGIFSPMLKPGVTPPDNSGLNKVTWSNPTSGGSTFGGGAITWPTGTWASFGAYGAPR